MEKKKGISGSTLKMIAIVTMLIDHIGAAVLARLLMVNGLGELDQTNTDAIMQWLSANGALYGTYTVMRMIGRVAFPIFCFLLVEGFVHTHNVKGYLGRLVLFGLLSEVPFDLAFFRTPFDPSAQNVYWTLALGVLAMAGLKHFEKPDGSASWKGLLCAAGCTLAALLACTDYNGIGVLIICALYLTRANRKRQCLAGALLFLFELTAPLAFVLVWFYNGQRGACSPLQKKAFYWFYPVHLLVLAGITNLLL